MLHLTTHFDTPGEKNRTEVELKNEKERKQESKVSPLNNANKTSGSVQFRVIILFPKVIWRILKNLHAFLRIGRPAQVLE